MAVESARVAPLAYHPTATAPAKMRLLVARAIGYLDEGVGVGRTLRIARHGCGHLGLVQKVRAFPGPPRHNATGIAEKNKSIKGADSELDRRVQTCAPQ